MEVYMLNISLKSTNLEILVNNTDITRYLDYFGITAKI